MGDISFNSANLCKANQTFSSKNYGSGLGTDYLKFFGLNGAPLLNNYHWFGKICLDYFLIATHIKNE